MDDNAQQENLHLLDTILLTYGKFCRENGILQEPFSVVIDSAARFLLANPQLDRTNTAIQYHKEIGIELHFEQPKKITRIMIEYGGDIKAADMPKPTLVKATVDQIRAIEKATL